MIDELVGRRRPSILRLARDPLAARSSTRSLSDAPTRQLRRLSRRLLSPAFSRHHPLPPSSTIPTHSRTSSNNPSPISIHSGHFRGDVVRRPLQTPRRPLIRRSSDTCWSAASMTSWRGSSGRTRTTTIPKSCGPRSPLVGSLPRATSSGPTSMVSGWAREHTPTRSMVIQYRETSRPPCRVAKPCDFPYAISRFRVPIADFSGLGKV